MADLATLGLVFETKGGEQAARVLDQVEQKARGAEKATDGLSNSSRGAASATEQLLGAIQKSVAQMEAMMRAQTGAAAAANDLARDQGAANAAIVQGYSVNARYTASFTSMSGQIAEATANTQRLGMATRQAGEAAESAAMDFATMYDAADRDFAVQYARAMDQVGGAHVAGARSARLMTHELGNLTQQFADVAVMTALGMSPLMTLITQGPQIATVFGDASARGVGFASALGDVAAMAGRVLAPMAPLILLTGAVAAGFAMLNRELAKGYPDDITDGLALTEEQLARVESRTVTLGDTFGATLEVMAKYLTAGPIGDGIDHLESRWNSWLDEFTQNSVNEIATVVGAFVGAYRTVINNWQSFPAAFGSAVAMGVNAALNAIEALINGAVGALNGFLARVNSLTGLSLPTFSEADLDRFKVQVSSAGEFVVRSFSANFETAREEAGAGLGRIADDIRTSAIARAQARAIEEAGDPRKQAAESRKAIDEQARAFERAKASADRYLETLIAQTRQLTMSRAEITALEVREQIAAAPLAEQKEAIRLAGEWLVILQQVQESSSQTLIDTGKHLHQAAEEVDTLREQFERTADMARGITWAVDDVARAIENKDWAGVFAGLLRTLERVKELWNSGQPGGKMSATGAVLGQVGGAVGGTAGTVISGIGSGFSAAGAAAGMAGMGGLGGAIAGMAGPIGIAVAGFSILSKVLSDGAAKRRAKAEQEANDIARARQVAEERAAKRAELEIELLRAQGDELAALTRERENELKALDSVSAAIQRQIYALEDWQKTVTAAESAVAQAEADLRRAYDIERDRLLGIIGGVDEARQALEQAYNREKSAIEATVNGVEGLIESLRDFRLELNLNPLAQGTLAQGRGAALAQFQAAAPGDAPGAGRAFLDASMASARTALDFQRDRALVARAIDDMTATAEMQLTDAEKQLAALDKQVAGLLAANDNLLSVEAAIRNLETAEQAAAVATAQLAALDAQVGALINLNAGFMSVAQAIDNLASAQQALAAAQAAKPDTSAGGGAAYEAVGFDGYVDRNADLAALYAAGTGMARGRSKTEFGQYHWERYGQAEDRFYRPFANGGMFSGGVVSGPTAFPMGVMGEAGPEAIMPLVNRGGRLGVEAANDGLKEEVRALRQEMAAMRSASERTARATEDSRDVLEGAARGQLSITTEAA